MACGVLGVALKEGSGNSEKLAEYAKWGLSSLNHRGEIAHGLAFVGSDGKLETRKSMGLVRDSRIFDKPILGNMLIGHTRYITSSTNSIENTQPIEFVLESGDRAAISHNGNLTNDRELGKMLGITHEGVSDTQMLGMLLSKCLQKENEVELIKQALSKVVGSYSIAIVVSGSKPKVIAIRDPFAIMPLSWGENEDGYFIFSESVAAGSSSLNTTSNSIEGGEMVVIDGKGVTKYKLFEKRTTKFDMFQFIYMGRPETEFEGQSVYAVRKRFGYEIAKSYKPDVDIVVPIMDSGYYVALGYSQATGLRLEAAIVKDRYESRRSFMQNDHDSRVHVASKKLNVIPQAVKGMKVLLVDDSIVRGTQLTALVEALKKAGTKEVHLAVSCPPIVSQCPYGIDFYDEELIARPYKGRPIEEIEAAVAKKIGLDSMHYQRIEGLVAAIGLPRERLCLGCLTGEYPQPFTPVSAKERKS
jgi:amidophosphoribosyltransferase